MSVLWNEERELNMRRVLLAIAIAAAPLMSAAADSTVKVEQGLLKGTVEQGLTVYRLLRCLPAEGDRVRWGGLPPPRRRRGRDPVSSARGVAVAWEIEPIRSVDYGLRAATIWWRPASRASAPASSSAA